MIGPIAISVGPCERRSAAEGQVAAATLSDLGEQVRGVPDGMEVELRIEGFLYPVAVAYVAALRQSLLDRGCAVRITGFVDYLRRIHFPGVAPDIATGRAALLRIHKTIQAEEFGRYARGEWLGHILKNVPPAAGKYLVMALGEVYENAFLHSGSQIGIALFGQYYPYTREYHFAMVDLGDGIPSSVAAFLNMPESAIDPGRAIGWAFERNNTTMPTARGSGLPILRTFATRNSGEVEVFSGSGYARLGITAEFRKTSGHIAATCINVILRNVSYVVRPEESLF